MWRKLCVLVIAAAIAGLGAFWFITIPAVVSAEALPAYTPNVANGEAVFNAGGCASCHGVAGEPRTMLGGGFGPSFAIRDVLRAEHLASQSERHW